MAGPAKILKSGHCPPPVASLRPQERLDGGNSSWSPGRSSRDLELLCDSGLRGLGEQGVMGGFVLVILLEPKTCACCTVKPFRLAPMLSARMWTRGELEAGLV